MQSVDTRVDDGNLDVGARAPVPRPIHAQRTEIRLLVTRPLDVVRDSGRVPDVRVRDLGDGGVVLQAGAHARCVAVRRQRGPRGARDRLLDLGTRARQPLPEVGRPRTEANEDVIAIDLRNLARQLRRAGFTRLGAQLGQRATARTNMVCGRAPRRARNPTEARDEDKCCNADGPGASSSP